MPIDHLQLKFSISSDLRELSRVRGLLEKRANKYGLKGEDLYLVASAVDEVCANLIEHDPKKWGKAKIHFTLRIDRENLEIEILDRGGYFNPTRRKTEKVDLEEVFIRRRGIGLVMVKKIMDEFFYSRTPDGDNLLTLRKFLHK